MNKQYKIKTALLLLAAFALCCGAGANLNDRELKAAEQITAKLSLEQKIGQMLMPAIPGKKMNPAALAMLQKYRPGGVILFGFNLGEAEDIGALTSALQKASMENSGLPLLISIDQEGGRVKRITSGVTQFPGNMAAGVANDKDLAYKWGQTLGLQLRTLGINMNLTPALDINNNAANPVINTRSFGADVDTVSNMGAAYVKGLQKVGCLASGKHFPGLGNSAVDNHHRLSIIDFDLPRIEAVELVPFQKAIDAGLDCMMTTHAAFPNILGSRDSATISSFFTTELLKNKMKFGGLVITDDMEMGGLTKEFDIGYGAVLAVKAGADIVLLSSWGGSLQKITDAILAEVKNGTISEDRINASVQKIIGMKLKYGIADFSEGKVSFKAFTPSKKETALLEEAEELNRKLTKASICYRGDVSLIAPPKETVRVFVSANETFIKHLNLDSNDKVVANFGGLAAAVSGLPSDTLIIVYAERYTVGAGFCEAVRRACGKRKVSVAVAVSGNPFPMLLAEDYDLLLMSFSDTAVSMEFLARAASGEYMPVLENKLLATQPAPESK